MAKKEVKPNFTFIDLFAGIGGFHLAGKQLGGKCVFSSEWDKAAQMTYEKNFGYQPFGDITDKENKQRIPKKFDLLFKSLGKTNIISIHSSNKLSIT